MLQVARLAPRLLGEAAARVESYLQEQFTAQGAARDRCGDPDLYYTTFAIEGLLALQATPPAARIIPYLQTFHTGAQLDIVHVACLARCWAALPRGSMDDRWREPLLQRIEHHRSKDGGYGPRPELERGTIYHCFLAMGAYQDLGEMPPDAQRMRTCVESLRTPDGGYANAPEIPLGTTSTTAAAITLLRQLDQTVPAGAGEWMLRCFHPEGGGFLAMPEAPMPDLLSTATALHALVSIHTPLDGLREACLDFLDSLWTGQGFCGHWADDQPDGEYTFYGLLALGHLSL